MYCGFDIGGTKVLGVAFDYQDKADPIRDEVAPVAVRREATIENGAAVIGAIENMLQGLESDCSTSFSAVGVGIAGIVDRDGVLRYSPNIEGVCDLEVRRLLQGSLGLPVVVENDATAATWAEWRLGAGRDSRHMLLVALGTGIGTGFVLDGRLCRGWNGFAGESGHMTVEMSGPMHVTGARGPWEYYASGSGLSRLARAAARTGRFRWGCHGSWFDISDTGRACAHPDHRRRPQCFECARRVLSLRCGRGCQPRSCAGPGSGCHRRRFGRYRRSADKRYTGVDSSLCAGR